VVAAQVGRVYANHAVPTAQQLANLNASVQGALDATALRLSSQAGLLPASNARLVPAIQNSILGSGRSSLASRISAVVLSPGMTSSAARLQSAIAQQISSLPGQIGAQFNRFFNTTNVAQAAVNSSSISPPRSPTYRRVPPC
jgi:hypothetical protein